MSDHFRTLLSKQLRLRILFIEICKTKNSLNSSFISNIFKANMSQGLPLGKYELKL